MFYDAGRTVKCHVDMKRVIAALQMTSIKSTSARNERRRQNAAAHMSARVR
jgi:hypothetical protein